jgi:hypothetical protein
MLLGYSSWKDHGGRLVERLFWYFSQLERLEKPVTLADLQATPQLIAGPTAAVGDRVMGISGRSHTSSLSSCVGKESGAKPCPFE